MAIRDAIVDFFSATHVAFESVEAESFLHLVDVLGGPGTRKLIPKADTIKSDADRKYRDKQNKVRTYFAKLDCGINLTLDIWTSPNGKAILAITCHWVDENYTLQELLLDAVELNGPHTGSNIAKHVIESLKQYEVIK